MKVMLPSFKKLVKASIIAVTILSLIALPLFLWAWQENKSIGVTTYHITDNKIPAAFASFRIAQIADLHNTQFGEGNTDLLELLQSSKPDIIVFTGDLLDARHPDMDVAVAFARAASEIAPCYYVSGNHEGGLETRLDFQERLSAVGVTVLDNASVEVTCQEQTITLTGVMDLTLQSRYQQLPDSQVMMNALTEANPDPEGFTLLLSHHPELFETYVQFGADLVLSGHAHGGQARLPGIGGVIAPNQGFFPEYDQGVYRQDETEMIVSRGLGNSLFPLRFNNPPELVMIELHSTQLKETAP